MVISSLSIRPAPLDASPFVAFSTGGVSYLTLREGLGTDSVVCADPIDNAPNGAMVSPASNNPGTLHGRLVPGEPTANPPRIQHDGSRMGPSEEAAACADPRSA